MAQQNHGHGRDDAHDANRVETIGRWVTVRQAAEHVGRSVDWVRRQYRSGSVDSRTRAGRYGPERLVDIVALRAVAEAPKVTTMSGASPAAPLPVLAETLHELARQLGEAQERAARAEAEAEEVRRRLALAEEAAAHHPLDSSDRGASDRGAPERGASDRDADLWLAANEQYLRALPGGAAREAAGVRLTGGRPADLERHPRRWWRPR